MDLTNAPKLATYSSMNTKPEIYVCTNLRLSGASCAGRGSFDVLKALRQQPHVEDGSVVVRDSVCMGYCGEGPNAKIIGAAFHHGVAPTDAERLVLDALKHSADKDAAKANPHKP